jgi:cation diffusion facilitator CzcD-associated flavoprotein CzcO
MGEISGALGSGTATRVRGPTPEVTAYCYSFDRDLFEQWKWSQRYPRQAEILAYLDMFVSRYDLRRSYVFDTPSGSARARRRAKACPTMNATPASKAMEQWRRLPVHVCQVLAPRACAP